VGERVTFAVAALGALGNGALVVTLGNAFRAAVALIGTLISVAVLFLLMAAPFVAVVQVIVYAGAIVVLFLFVIAYLGDRGATGAPDRLARVQVFAWIAVLVLLGQGLVVLLNTKLAGIRDNPREVSDIGSPEAIGRAFLNEYLVPFEATSLVLLVAAVGAVLLAKRAVQAEGGR
jgi:NADH:ubiquinone oxidoreductase subunit 6 (subunit J)